jgi:hypothetical protein
MWLVKERFKCLLVRIDSLTFKELVRSARNQAFHGIFKLKKMGGCARGYSKIL